MQKSFFSVIATCLALCSITSASKAEPVSLIAGDTCLVQYTYSSTPTPGLYDITVSCFNFGDDYNTVFRTSAMNIYSGAAVLSVLRLSASNVFAADTDNYLAIPVMGSAPEHVLGRTLSGTISFTGGLQPSELEGGITQTLQHAIQPIATPTPGAVSVIGLAGIVAVRRRR